MRYRSIDESYIPYIIKEYRHWTLMINENQRYLGRCVLWLAREGCLQDKCDLSEDEEREFSFARKQTRDALTLLWKPDLFNYAWFGNLIDDHGGHGHEHIIPRYKYPRVFLGTEFTDLRWKQNCSPTEGYFPDHKLLHQIRGAIQVALTTV
ncbi:MAG: hypothetical protein KBD06_04565 [Candidatus Pacebacteria bacterium]|nr:hypothetical protein [Candidatus Paceibacterota bacterium]